jgi:AcrR family transcriptional regulator
MPRVRSAQAHRKVLEAAVCLFADQGIDATSMDTIAAASGVSKATIYKHWRDKDKLALEVLSYLHGMDEDTPTFNSGDLRTDLVSQLSFQPARDRAHMKERILPHMIAYSARNRVFGAAWRELAVQRQCSGLRLLLERGIRQRKLVQNLDMDLCFALLLGPMFYRHIFSPKLEDNARAGLAEQVVDAFWRAFSSKAVI